MGKNQEKNTMTEQQLLSRRKLAWLIGIPKPVLENIAEKAATHYRPYKKERPGKKPRIIDNPDATLKNVQQRINRGILKGFSFPDYIQGGVRGRSPITNASQHLGKRLVIGIDLEDFFPSVTDIQVYGVWLERFGCSPTVASLLTALTTFRNHLPQGSPTSSSLANLALMKVDSVILEVTSRHNCSYTRYVDDLTISGDEPQRALDSIASALRGSGYRISRRKLSLMPASGRQEVTGLSVNSRQAPSVPRYKRERVRAAIHQLPQGASADSEAISTRGRISHFSRTNPGNARLLLRLFERKRAESSEKSSVGIAKEAGEP